MPVTARLSKLFYERLGEQATNELVDWFNAVDATYKAELREMNELNFSRFDAKMGERLADFRTELKGDIAGLRTELKGDIAGLRTELKGDIAGLRTELKGDIADLRAELTGQLGVMKSDMIKLMFLFWTGTALAGLLTR